MKTENLNLSYGVCRERRKFSTMAAAQCNIHFVIFFLSFFFFFLFRFTSHKQWWICDGSFISAHTHTHTHVQITMSMWWTRTRWRMVRFARSSNILRETEAIECFFIVHLSAFVVRMCVNIWIGCDWDGCIYLCRWVSDCDESASVQTTATIRFFFFFLLGCASVET